MTSPIDTADSSADTGYLTQDVKGNIVNPTSRQAETAVVNSVSQAGNVSIQSAANADVMDLNAILTNGNGDPVLEGPGDMQGMLILYQKLRNAVSQTRTENVRENVQVNGQKQQEFNELKWEKIVEAADKMRDAQKQGLFGKIFGWVATIAAAIAAAALILSGIGAPAAVALMAGTSMALLNQISAETGNWMVEGIAKIFVDGDMTQEEKEEAAGWLIMGISTALTLGVGVAGLAKAFPKTVEKLSQIGSKLANLGKSTADEGAAALGKGTANAGKGTAAAGRAVPDEAIAKTVLERLSQMASAASRETSKATASVLSKVDDYLLKNIDEVMKKIGTTAGQGANKTEKMTEALNRVISVSSISAGGSSVAQGTSTIMSGNSAHDAQNLQSESIEYDAQAVYRAQQRDSEVEAYRTEVDQLNKGLTILKHILERNQASMSKLVHA